MYKLIQGMQSVPAETGVPSSVLGPRHIDAIVRNNAVFVVYRRHVDVVVVRLAPVAQVLGLAAEQAVHALPRRAVGLGSGI